MQRFISPSIAQIWFEQFLKEENLRRLESHSVGLSRFFDERLRNAKTQDEPPPIACDPEETSVSPETATRMFRTLCEREDLATTELCVSILKRFMRQRLEEIKNDRVAA